MGANLNFSGINLAMRGLLAAQQAINTAGHDITNANTEGFSRQAVKLSPLSAGLPITVRSDFGSAGLGGGVDVTGIVRIRDQFLDTQYRHSNRQFGEFEAINDTIRQIEGLFNEPSDSGLNVLLGRFYDAWHDLSANPTEAAARATVRESAFSLAAAFNEISSGLLNTRETLDARIVAALDDINGMLEQVANLNKQISTATGMGVAPNNLMDQRDLLLDQLAKFTDVQTSDRNDGSTWIFLSGKAVVQADKFTKLEAVLNGELRFHSIAYNGETMPPNQFGGQLKALIELRDKIVGRGSVPTTSSLPDVPGGMAYQFDALANKFAEAVNKLHKAGTPMGGGIAAAGASGIDLFVIDSSKGLASQFNTQKVTAGNIAVNPVFYGIGSGSTPPLDLLAAGGPPSGVPLTAPFKGDNATALAVAQLRQKLTIDGTMTAGAAGQYTSHDYYRNLLASLGVQGLSAQKLFKNQQALLDHVDAQRQAISGVNLDEEMANMIKFQHTYAASARMLSTFDQLLDRIINSMGV